jgi:hypothetical protein
MSVQCRKMPFRHYIDDGMFIFHPAAKSVGPNNLAMPQNLIATVPRSPRRGAPYAFVTTEKFLVAFALESLRDLPDKEQLEDAGMTL